MSELDLSKNSFSLNDIFKFEPEELESKVFCMIDKPTFTAATATATQPGFHSKMATGNITE